MAESRTDSAGQVHTAAVRPTLLIVDDHDGFRSVARAMLDGPGFDVVGEAADGARALSAGRRLLPAVVLLDVNLPDGDGFEVSARLSRLSPPPRVVLTSSRPVTDLRRRLAASDAVAFLPKDQLSVESLAEVLGR